jgi:hypothetical protein
MANWINRQLVERSAARSRAERNVISAEEARDEAYGALKC